MQWIVSNSNDPAFNLALEEYFLSNIPENHEGYGMLWQNKSCIVVGKFQNAYQEVNVQYTKENNIKVVRRVTGGGAVYHDLGTLNYTFINYLGKNGELPSFSEMGKPIATALQNIGLDVYFAGRNDLLLENMKVAGLAHCYEKNRCLHHGCILVNTDLDVLVSALNVDPSKYISKGIQSVRKRVGNLADYYAEKFPKKELLTPENVRLAILEQVGSDSFYQLNDKEIEEVNAIRDAKYNSWEWTYGASPNFTEKKSKRFAWGKVEFLFNVDNGFIEGCRVFGDFFTSLPSDTSELNNVGELQNLEAVFKGVKYTPQDMQQALETFPLEKLFNACDIDQLKEFIIN